jgi:hypothetical protein
LVRRLLHCPQEAGTMYVPIIVVIILVIIAIAYFT